MHLISKSNKGICFLLCVIDIYSRYAWVVLLKDQKDITIINAFQRISNKLKCKPNKYGSIKGVNFIIDQWNHGYKKWNRNVFNS